MNMILLRNVMTYLFNDASGQFNWLGITSVVAVLGLVFNAWDNRKKFKADLISKNRIEWLQYVRENSAAFISDCILYSEYSPIIKFFPVNVRVKPTNDGGIVTADLGQKIEKSKYSEIVKDPELEKLRVSLNLIGNKMLLCFYNKQENKKIIDNITNILEIINKEHIKANEKAKIKKESKDLRDNLSNYFKKEWEKAKRGK